MLALLPILTWAQYDKMLKTMDDEMEVLENGKLVLRFINAENGNPVEATSVSIEGIGEYTFCIRKAMIEPPEDKTHVLQLRFAIYNL